MYFYMISSGARGNTQRSWSAGHRFRGGRTLTGINNIFDRRLLVAVDAAGYGGGNDQEHFAMQSGLTAVLDVAATRANLRRELWIKQPAGDGELAILPRDEPEPVVVD